MSKPVTVSVIIPAYNEEQCLPARPNALAAQTVKPFEVIVVDNASTDKTAEVAARYPFVTVLREPERGRVFARKAGFRHASGTILADLMPTPLYPKLGWNGFRHFINLVRER